MAKANLTNDPLDMMRQGFAKYDKLTTEAEVTFGVTAYHMFHVIMDQERMGAAFRIGPEWMNVEGIEGRKAIKARILELGYPMPERAKGVAKTKDLDRAKTIRWVGEAVEMLAGMCRMGEMFTPGGAQWDDASKQWLVPIAWFIEEGQIATCTLSGKKNVLHPVHKPVPFVSTVGVHTVTVHVTDADGDLIEKKVGISPHRGTIAKLGMPKQVRVQSQAEDEGTPVVQAGNLLSKLLDQAEEMKQPAITGDAADAFADVIARIVRNPHLWQLVQSEREAFLKEQNASKAAA